MIAIPQAAIVFAAGGYLELIYDDLLDLCPLTLCPLQSFIQQ